MAPHHACSHCGLHLSTLTLSLAPTQVPGGALADKLGAKNVMTATLLLSGLCCIAVPLVAGPFGLLGVWCAIALMGAFQGPMFPTSSVFLSKWMPGKDAPGGDEKAWGTSLTLALTLTLTLTLALALTLTRTRTRTRTLTLTLTLALTLALAPTLTLTLSPNP